MRIGVLALQGDFASHGASIRRSGFDAAEVRKPADLAGLDGLIIPGGESTTMLKLIWEDGLGSSIQWFASEGKPIFGTCAGAIILASRVLSPAQPSLNLIDIDIERNAYGRQIDSFVDVVETSSGAQVEAVFIRAPRIRRVGPGVEVLAQLSGEAVFVRQRNILAATFHPELTRDDRIHRLFLEAAAGGAETAAAL